MKLNNHELLAFQNAYIACAFWSSTDGDDEPLDENFDDGDLSEDARNGMHADCLAFCIANAADILCDGAPLAEYWDGATDGERKAAMAGHDFWLTRNGHGAGFWDSGWPEPAATRLDNAAKAFGSIELYVGDDGAVHRC